MLPIHCDNLVITCIDFRIQSSITSWLQEHFHNEKYDYASFAGGVKNLSFAEDQIAISKRLHKVKRIIIIAHEDCGAYGGGTAIKEAQILDLQKAKKEISKRYPHLEVQTRYVSLKGDFEEIPSV